MSKSSKITATVVHVVDEYKAAINKGSEHGVNVGDTYLVYSVGPELTDPDTGESLGALELVKGRVVVRHVQDKISTVESNEFDETPGRRKIIKKDGGLGMNAILLGLGQREVIEEEPERSQRALGAEKGNLAKLLSSK